LALVSVRVAGAQPGTSSPIATELAANYQLPDGGVIGINAFAGDSGSPAPFFTDYRTGEIRTLFSLPADRLVMGRSLGIQAPVERNVRVIRNGSGAVAALGLQRPGEDEVIATRLSADVSEISFESSDATIKGTLLLPATKGPHPAIVLLHGSGPLTRYSFGPYPRFFASLGLAVLTYDKRGSGASTGAYFPRTALYPEPYLRDAVAAVRFLKSRPDVKATQIGLWGTSEGGMLTTQVAAVEDVAFAINSSGFMMPMWQQVLYNIEAQLRADGFSASDVDDAVAFETLAIDVMRTGNGWAEYERAQAAALRTKWWPAYFGASKGFSSLEAIRWQWDHVYSFDPLVALKRTRGPVLGLFGALDVSTPATRAARAMEETLRSVGHADVTVRIFERANHPLMEARSGGNAEVPSLTRMVPGLFDTLRSWIDAHVTVGR
jgi:dienelactone hydrolase